VEKKIIITKKIIKDDLKFKGKLIFAANLGTVRTEGNIRARKVIVESGTYIYSGGSIYSSGYIHSGGPIYSAGEIRSGGSIYSGGEICSGGNILFSYHLKFKSKISCKLLRISPNNEIEREFWLNKCRLFGFEKMAKTIETGCVTEIRARQNKLSKTYKTEVLSFPFWTQTERMVIKSWFDSELAEYVNIKQQRR